MLFLLFVANLIGSRQERIQNPEIEVFNEKLKPVRTTIATNENY